ncbi:MAG: hypothetical protein ACYDAR_06305 [Thermomicrobiales bacterium]
MSAEPYKIDVHPNSELAASIDTAEAEKRSIVLNKNGVRYRIIREADDIWEGYDPAAVIAGMNAAAGSITVEEAERIKNLVYEAREAGTRPNTRP